MRYHHEGGQGQLADVDPKTVKPRIMTLTQSTYDGVLYNTETIKQMMDGWIDTLHFDEAWLPHAAFHKFYGSYHAMGKKRGRPQDLMVFATQSTHKLLAGISQASQVLVEDSQTGANGPPSGATTKIFQEPDILVCPDILANGGGVIVSYFEWVQSLQYFFWTESEVNERMRQVIVGAFDKVWELKTVKKIDMRTAAMGQAVRRLERAMLLRGLSPR